MNGAPRKWFAASFSAPADYAEALEFAVGSMNALGSEIGMSRGQNDDPVQMTVYFDAPPDLSKLQQCMADSLLAYGLDPLSISTVEIKDIDDQDWLAEWKRHWKPVRIGRLVIAAPWHDVEDEDGVVVRIEPNMAFGTGTHETTRSCLAALNELIEDDISFLDVGTGTGILAIAAARLAPGAGPIAACDTDEDALAIAAENARFNGVAERINFVGGTLDGIEGEFDVVAANLTADTIVPILDDLIRRSKKALVLSGILAEQERMIVERLPEGALHRVDRDGEWIAIVLTK